jgi:hypothetical protein
MTRLDTRLESEGAEFLVLGQLLLHKIPSYKTYTNMPGYDLVATNPENNRSAMIQVKSRWHTGATQFPIKNFECDFVVVVLLNRGSKDGKRQVRAPQYFIIPVKKVMAAPRSEGWGKVKFRDLDIDQYENRWDQIAKFLKMSKLRRVKRKATRKDT